MAIGRPIEQTPNIADKVVTATATAGQTQFTVDGGYRINHLAVFRNGVRLVNGNDFTALDGSTITLMEDASNLDVLEFQVFDTFNVSDALLTNAASQTVNGDVTVVGTFTVGTGGIGTFVAAEVDVGIVSSTTGITTIQSLQAASSTTTGALQVKGGVGIGKSLYVGGNVSVGGTLTYEDVTNVDSVGVVTAGKGVRITTGGLVVTAGVSTFAGITTVTNTAALHSKQLNVSAGSTFGGAVTANDTLTVAGNLDIADTIYHTGDSNTKIRFPANDTIALQTAGTEAVRVDASQRLLINTTTEGNANADNLTIADSGVCGMTIRSGTTSTGNIYFSDATSGDAEFAGAVEYDHSSNSLRLHTNEEEKLRIASDGDVIIGGSDSGYAGYADNLTIHGASNEGITIRSGTAHQGAIYFSDATGTGTGTYEGNIIYDHNVNSLMFGSNHVERLRIDSSGRVLVGHTASAGKDSTLQVIGTGGDLLDISRYVASEYGPNLHFVKSRNGTAGSHTIVQSGDALGIINFRGSDGNSFDTAAEIGGEVDGTPGSGDMPGRLVFKTTADGSSSATERLRIDKDGNIIQHSMSGSADGSADDLVIGSTSSGTNRGMTIYSHNAQNGSIAFADNDNNFKGAVQYMHNGDRFRILTGGQETYRVQSGGTDGQCTFYMGGATNNQNKSGALTLNHYTYNTYNQIDLIRGTSTSGVNKIEIGGSDSSNGSSAATSIQLYTAANATTNNGTLRLKIDSSGRLLVGTTETSSNQSGALNVFGTDGNTSFVSIRRGSADAGGPRLAMCKSRNTTDGAASGLVADNDALGTIHFYGNDSQGFEEGASIAAEVDGSPGSNDIPTRLIFSTTPDGSDTKEEKMRITEGGKLITKNAPDSSYMFQVNESLGFWHTNTGLAPNSTRTWTISGMNYGHGTFRLGGLDGNYQRGGCVIELVGGMWATHQVYYYNEVLKSSSGASVSIAYNTDNVVVTLASSSNWFYYSATWEQGRRNGSVYATITTG